ncbi:unnamed protein product [Phytomonas sp. Hart1]|nr:unnamed protein product [Phytomonas sp. Hart1]|eukprot:CCW68360.1 unnamed protein product [Phytomonas sp. isolate Hart1]
MFSWGNFARQTQEHRLEQLTDDNAFVNVKAVLSPSSAIASASMANGSDKGLNGGTKKVSHRNRDEMAMDFERHFFETESTGGSGSFNATADGASGALRVDRLRGGEFGANERLNLTQCFNQQHKHYLEVLAQAQKEATEKEGTCIDESYDNDDSRSIEETHGPKTSETLEDEAKVMSLRQGKRTRAGKKINMKKRQQAPLYDTPTKGQPQRWHLKQGEARCWCPMKAEDVDTKISDEMQLLRAWYSEMARFEDSDDNSEEEHDTTDDNITDTRKRDGQHAKKSKIHGMGLKEDKTRKVKSEYEQQHFLAPSLLRFLTSCPSYIAMTSPSPLSPSSSASRGRVKKVTGCHTHHLCSVCLLPAAYRCARCRYALFCSIKCHVSHDATRCLKYTV